MKPLFVALTFILCTPVMAQSQPPMDMAKAFLQQFDKDNNGAVSLDEFLAPNKEQFRFMDNNSDGYVDSGEVKLFERKMMEMYQQYQQQQPMR